MAKEFLNRDILEHRVDWAGYFGLLRGEEAGWTRRGSARRGEILGGGAPSPPSSSLQDSARLRLRRSRQIGAQLLRQHLHMRLLQDRRMRSGDHLHVDAAARKRVPSHVAGG